MIVNRGATARLFRLEALISRLGVKCVETGMPNPIPPDKVNYQKHEQRAANQHSDCDLQAKLQVTKIGNPPYHVRTQAADQLRGKHVHADRSGVRAARHHVMKNGGVPALIHSTGKKSKSPTLQPPGLIPPLRSL